MLINRKYIPRLIVSCFSVLLLVGCMTDDYVCPDTTTDINTGQSSFLALGLTTSKMNDTRSDTYPPKGGEWGDGREIGQDYENLVTTVAAFLYQDEDGINGSSTTPVTLVYFAEGAVSGEQNTTNNIDYIATTIAQEVSLEPGFYNVLAIANPDDISWAQTNSSLTLGDVRDYISKSAWTETSSSGTTSYSSFLMTSENEGAGVTLVYNTEDDPAIAEVDVERMAARVDYKAEGTFTITPEDDANYTGSTIEITGAAIVNNLTQGSYLFKRVSEGYGDDVTYLGEETADANYIATNYVIDPWTDEKLGGDQVTIDGVQSDVSELYGVYYPGNATDGDEQDPSYWANLVTPGTPISDGSETWYRVGYTMENTTYADYTSKKYSTAIVFAATFTPADGTVRNTFYSDYDFFEYGKSTFFKWDNVLYATAEDMMAVAYPNVFTAEDMFGETTFSSISDMDALATFIATLREDDPTGYKHYLESITEFPTSISELYWVTYMENVCGYKFDSTEGVIINAFDVETTYGSTRAALNTLTDGLVSTYEDSQCYYTWWIRHSNDATTDYDGNETNGIMEYSVVRNNIYKLNVTSVYSIGGDIPQEGLRIYVYVKDWTMLDEEVINL